MDKVNAQVYSMFTNLTAMVCKKRNASTRGGGGGGIENVESQLPLPVEVTANVSTPFSYM